MGFFSNLIEARIDEMNKKQNIKLIALRLALIRRYFFSQVLQDSDIVVFNYEPR